MNIPKQRLSWLGSITSLLAVATCYGTLAAVTLLSLIGVSVDIDEATLVKLITGLLVIALLGMVYSWRIHRHPGPLLLSLGAAALLLWVFYGSYSKPLELAGFALLVVASVWDFRAKKRTCTDSCHAETS
jgi:arsenite methyltransferase